MAMKRQTKPVRRFRTSKGLPGVCLGIKRIKAVKNRPIVIDIQLARLAEEKTIIKLGSEAGEDVREIGLASW